MDPSNWFQEKESWTTIAALEQLHRDAVNILDAAFDGDTNPSAEEVAMADTAAPPQIKRS